MKILVITDLYPVQNNEKHTPRTIFNFVKCWKRMGHEVRVIKPNFLLNSFLRGKPFYKSGFYGDVENINYFLPFLGEVRNKIQTEFTPDVVVAHMPSGILLADKLGLPFVAAVHASDIEVLTNPLYKSHFKPRLEAAYRHASRIAARSDVLKNKFLKLYPELENKIFTAYSGVDGAILRIWQNREKVRVLTCGKFIKRKNIDKVIKACDRFENIELTVIGEGKENLRKLSDKPVFMGQISHDEVISKMRDSDIFILPSENETFGMVYLEAMATGCITVCRKGDGIDGIIKDGVNGFLCDDVDDVIKRILEFENKDSILANAYKTVCGLDEMSAAENYINYLADIKH